MAQHSSAFPFFIPTEERPLTAAEFAVVETLVRKEALKFASSLPNLRVVGRCGCGACPTIFFQRHEPGDNEREVASYTGKDDSGGLVGAALLEKVGALSQLEFYSVDGHEPWLLPRADTLEKL